MRIQKIGRRRWKQESGYHLSNRPQLRQVQETRRSAGHSKARGLTSAHDRFRQDVRIDSTENRLARRKGTLRSGLSVFQKIPCCRRLRRPGKRSRLADETPHLGESHHRWPSLAALLPAVTPPAWRHSVRQSRRPTGCCEPGLTHIIEIAVGVSRRLNLTNQTRLEVEIIHANVATG